jgi:hypothetical protein
MPEETKTDDVEKYLSEQKSMEDRKQALIADLLSQREAVIKTFDDKLGKLGYRANSAGRPKRSHHSKESVAPAASAQQKPKPKA